MIQRLRPALAVVAAVLLLAVTFALVTLLGAATETLATARVERGPVEVRIRVAARTHVRDRYAVRAPMHGVRPLLHWHAGDRVTAGEHLLDIVPLPDADHEQMIGIVQRQADHLRGAVAAARNSVDAARSRAEAAAAEHVRLAPQGGPEAATAEFRARDAAAHLRSAEFALDVANHGLDDARSLMNLIESNALPDVIPVRAAVAGVVLAVNTVAGERIDADEALLEIGVPESMEAHAFVTSEDTMLVEPGMHTTLRDPDDRSELRGEVRHVESALLTNGAGEVRVTIAPLLSGAWSSLADNTSLQAEIEVWRGDDVIRAPVEALYRQEDRWMVFVVRGGRAYATPVTIGHRGDRHVEIRAGLQPGEIVVLEPAAAADGMRVTPR